MALRLLLMAVAAAISFGLLAVYVSNATAGVADRILTVNSVANDVDAASCTGAPNAGTGDCTLREAINDVNAGLADTINFHKAVFSKESPGVIFIDTAVPGNLGCLPSITVQVTIDSTNTGVILDGDANNDTTAQICAPNGVIDVDATLNGFDFTFLGGKNFIIRQFDGGTDGIRLDGNDTATCLALPAAACSFGDVTITGYVFQDGDITGAFDYGSGDGIDIDDTVNVINGSFTNNNITADDDGIDIEAAAGTKLTSSRIEISGNTIIGDFDLSGSGEAVDVNYEDPLNGKITVLVHDNVSLTSLGDDAVDIEYCQDAGGCDAGESAINVQVNDNAKIHGGNGAGDSGVEVEIDASSGVPNSGPVDVDVQVNGNGLTDSGGGDGIRVDVDVCCDTSFSTSSVTVNGNDDVIGNADAVQIDVDVGCGDGNESTVNVNDNGSLEGQSGDGVDLDVDVGQIGAGCDAAGESDENSSVITVNNNDRIDGGGAAEDGVDIDVDVGAASGAGDDNTNTVEVAGNGQIDGDEDGVEVDADAGSQTGPDGDNNTATVTVRDNANITGARDAGVDISADTGVEEGPTAHPGTAVQDHDADQNLTQVFVRDNGNITGNQATAGARGGGVQIEVQSGGGTASSVRNANVVQVTGNGEIVGRTGNEADGLYVDMEVCCDSANTNTLTVADNGDIIGRNADGIEIDLCCSTNIVSIVDNDVSDRSAIRGNGGDGINYRVDVWSDGDADFAEPCPQECGLFTSVNFLTISGNEIFNSQNDGINICCGAFQFPTEGPGAGTVLKSVITDNVIRHNRDHGIEIHSSFGLNITENEIFGNGDDPSVDRGIEIDSDVDPAIDLVDTPAGEPNSIQTNLADAVLAALIEATRANRNTISENSIYDNIGLGIDLIGDPDKDGDGDHGIGCNSFGGIPSPNDCIPFPTIQTQSLNKLRGTACADCLVEVFLADATPADQPPLGTQQGEGRTFLVSGTADSLGVWSITLPCGLGEERLTATATDKTKNTSEFSVNFLTLGTSSCATATPTATDTPTVTNTPTITNTPTVTNTPTNTVVPPTATATTPTKVCGDVNQNGAVNSVDAQLILQFKAGLIDSLANPDSADVNGDGEITSVDAALILQLEAGLITELTGCA